MKDSPSIPARLLARFDRRRERTALVTPGRTWTYGELADEVRLLAAGFRALGVRPGMRISHIAENSDLWILTDLALLSAGAVTVPRGGDASAEEVRFVTRHAAALGVVAEDAAQLAKVAPALGDTTLPPVVTRGPATGGAVTLDEVRGLGSGRDAPDPGDVRSSDLATIIYTSGTTGNPKGVRLTHANILHNVDAVPTLLAFREDDRFLSFLPTWHSFERTIEYVVLDSGMTLCYSSRRALRHDLQRFRPTFLIGVPRIYEMILDGVLHGIDRAREPLRSALRACLGASRVRHALRRRRLGLSLSHRCAVVHPGPLERALLGALETLLLPPDRLADRLVYRRIRAALGGAVAAAVSGGGPLPIHVDEFLVRAGVPLLQGYGLTETAPVLCVRTPRRNIPGTIGLPLPATEIRIVDDAGRPVPAGVRGVIEARGPQVMSGYHENDGATAAALRADGWFHTGDIGMLTDEGDVLITGRAKDTIVLRGGENVEPETIEAALRQSPLIADAVVVGHGQKHLGALLLPDMEALRARLGSAPANPAEAPGSEADRLVRAEAARLVSPERGFRVFERVPRIGWLPEPLSPETETLTLTLKKRRAVIEERFRDLIAALFRDD